MAKECVWLAGLAWVCIVGWVGVGAGWCGDSYLDGEFDEGHGNRGDDIKGKASCHIVL